jgi:hypothetical protein
LTLNTTIIFNGGVQRWYTNLIFGDQRYIASPGSVERCTEEKLVVHKKTCSANTPSHLTLSTEGIKDEFGCYQPSDI